MLPSTLPSFFPSFPSFTQGLKSNAKLVENWIWEPWHHRHRNQTVKASENVMACKPNYLGRTEAQHLLTTAGIKQIIFIGDSVMGGFIRTFTDFLGVETAEVTCPAAHHNHTPPLPASQRTALLTLFFDNVITSCTIIFVMLTPPNFEPMCIVGCRWDWLIP